MKMGKKRGIRKAASNRNQTKVHTRNKPVLSLEDEYFCERGNRTVARMDDDSEDVNAKKLYSKKDKLMLSGYRRESNSEEEPVYAMSSEISDSETDVENRIVSLEQANDLVARFVKKKELDSDIDEGGDQNSLPDAKAWGRRRQDFYSTDFVDKDVGALSEKEKEVARMEENEARAIQERLTAEVDEDAFGLQDLQAPEAESKNDVIMDVLKVQQQAGGDLSELPYNKQVTMVSKESPELQCLLNDCKAKLREVDMKIVPMIELLPGAFLRRGTSVERYLRLRYNLLTAYTTNICFYLNLKAKRMIERNHPIVKRLSQFKRCISELDSNNTLFLNQVQQTLKIQSIESNMQNKSCTRASQSTLIKSTGLSCDDDLGTFVDEVQNGDESIKKNVKIKTYGISKASCDRKCSKRLLSAAELEIMALYGDGMCPVPKKVKNNVLMGENETKEIHMKNTANSDGTCLFGDTDSENDEPVFKTRCSKLQHENDDTNQTDENEALGNHLETIGGKDDEDAKCRRAINYQIAKNKGLTPRRAKYMRNPRVRHRIKFRKANVRRKGQVRTMRDENQHRYGGEISGINARVIKSVKLY